jgi:hypothetical protein
MVVEIRENRRICADSSGRKLARLMLRRQPVAEAQAQKAGQQAHILENSKGMRAGRMPANHRHFGIEGQHTGEKDGRGDPAIGNGLDGLGAIGMGRLPPGPPAGNIHAHRGHLLAGQHTPT